MRRNDPVSSGFDSKPAHAAHGTSRLGTPASMGWRMVPHAWEHRPQWVTVGPPVGCVWSVLSLYWVSKTHSGQLQRSHSTGYSLHWLTEHGGAVGTEEVPNRWPAFPVLIGNALRVLQEQRVHQEPPALRKLPSTATAPRTHPNCCCTNAAKPCSACSRNATISGVLNSSQKCTRSSTS